MALGNACKILPLNTKCSVLPRRLVKLEHRTLHTQGQQRKAIAPTATADLKAWDLPAEKTDTSSTDSVASTFEQHRLDLSFQNASEAYKSRKNHELLRALFVFKMCGINTLVNHNKKLLQLGRTVLGKRLFEYIMRSTFYGQFVAGANEEDIKPSMKRNMGWGVKSILDYSVEKDLSKEEATQAELESCISDAQPANIESLTGETPTGSRYLAHEQFADRRDNVSSARTYFYHDEFHCDENMQNFLNGIDAVSGATNCTGFTAVKLTALGRPQLLLQLSEVLHRVRQFYSLLCDMDNTDATNKTACISQERFEQHLSSFSIGKEEVDRWFTLLDTTKDGVIDLLDWHNLLEVNIRLAKLFRVPNIKTGKFEPLATALTEQEEEQMKNMLNRIDIIIKYGKEKGVRVMIDAEQTYFQAAINRLVMEMMRKYNSDKAVVFNTYQCYLKDALNMITSDLALSKREDFYFGAKLVRGAYMEQERERAQTLGYEDPINPTFDATTAMYESVLTHTMEEIGRRERGKIAIMIASHNEDTIRFTVEQMQKYGITPRDHLICFGQLLGMCDHVSFSLGQAGYSVYKYTPYGPVEEVLPYLSRRAMENGGLLQKVEKEKRLMKAELKRRLLAGKWFYTPPPPPPNASISI